MHWMCRKEGDDRIDQILSSTHHVAIQVLLVVVISLVRDNSTHTEEVHKLIETRDALCALRHSKLMGHLIAGFVAFSTRSVMLPNKADGEATLSVYKTNNPTSLKQPFLLIFCTHHIITIPSTSDGIVVWDTQIFQHMAGCAPRSYLRGGQRFTLGPFLLLRLGSKPKRSAHFWPTLMVAHESGLSHPAPGLEDRLGV